MRIFGPKLKKVGSLQISINAIVILILAITILGLGLGFVKRQFGGLEEQFGQVRSEIQSEIIEKIKSSGELLVFNKVEIEAKVGKPEKFYIGIKNTGTSQSESGAVCFRTAIKCVKPLSTDYCDEATSSNDVIMGGTDSQGNTALTMIGKKGWFTVFDEVNVKTGEVGVFPVTLQVADAKPDTYLMEMSIYQPTEPVDCAAQPGSWSSKPYQSKQFYIILK